MNTVNTYKKNNSFQQKKKKLFVGIFLLFVFLSSAQLPVIDSLKTEIKKYKKSESFNVTDTVYIKLLNKLGNHLRYYKTDSLYSLSKEALDYSKKAQYKTGEIYSLIGLGCYYSDKGDHVSSIEYLEKALEFSQKINNKSLELNALNKIAGEHSYKGNYGDALSGYLKAIEIAKETHNKFMLSILNENIATLYSTQKDFEQAMAYYKETKKINEELNNPVYTAETLSNMASVYSDMGELEYAMFSVNASIVTFENKKILDWLAYAYNVKGKIYLEQKKYKWAIHWYKQSELLHNNIEDVRAEIILLNGMAEAYLGLKQDSISEIYATKAFDYAKKINDKESLVECAKTLYKINKNKNNFQTALDYHEIFQTLTDTLSKNMNRKGLTMLKTKIEHEKQKEELISANKKALAKQKKYVNIALAVLSVFIGLTLFIRRNERIQKNLNIELNSKKEKLEKSEKQLKGINKTKDRLFSIIGHDLRGPIGAFQGLLKMFRDGDMSKEEFLGFVPKLRVDIDNISFTLNNLLSWGQTQMNGATTTPTVISIHEISGENINLLSEIAAGKNIKIVNNISENTLSWADVNQVDIVFRNLISNALKFTPNSGIITIGSNEKNSNWEFFIKDTGIGMDEKAKTQIFSDNSNYTTYGTNNEKGTGLGLSLCKEMIEKNNGKIWVESAPNKGSCFYFTLPKGNNKLKNTA